MRKKKVAPSNYGSSATTQPPKSGMGDNWLGVGHPFFYTGMLQLRRWGRRHLRVIREREREPNQLRGRATSPRLSFSGQSLSPGHHTRGGPVQQRINSLKMAPTSVWRSNKGSSPLRLDCCPRYNSSIISVSFGEEAPPWKSKDWKLVFDQAGLC